MASMMKFLRYAVVSGSSSLLSITALVMWQADGYRPGVLGILTVLWLCLMASNAAAFLYLCNGRRVVP